MLRLIDRSGLVVELQVVGYQFPNNATDEFDSNWLVIEGRVRHRRGDWSFRDPCLLTYEAAELADWLEDVGAGREQESSIRFIEPNLKFGVRMSGGQRALRLEFALEARPPWASRSDDVAVEFPLAGLDLFGAVKAWRTQLTQFPQRAER